MSLQKIVMIQRWPRKRYCFGQAGNAILPAFARRDCLHSPWHVRACRPQPGTGSHLITLSDSQQDLSLECLRIWPDLAPSFCRMRASQPLSPPGRCYEFPVTRQLEVLRASRACVPPLLSSALYAGLTSSSLCGGSALCTGAPPEHAC